MSTTSGTKSTASPEKRVRLNNNARKIIELLETEGAMSQRNIAKQLDLAPRSTRTVLKKLLQNDIVSKIPNLEDMRTSTYFLKENYMEIVA